MAQDLFDSLPDAPSEPRMAQDLFDSLPDAPSEPRKPAFKGPTISQGTYDPYGGVLPTIGTAVEKAISGLTFGLSEPIERLVGSALDIEALSPVEMERRAEASPIVSAGAEIAGGLAQGGLGALKSLSPRLFGALVKTPIIGDLVRLSTTADIAGNTTRSLIARAEARAASGGAKTYANFVDDAAMELERLRLLKSQNIISPAEAKVLDAMEARTLLERGAQAVEAKLPTVAKPVTRALEKRAVKERAQYVVTENLLQQSKNLGFTDTAKLRALTAAAVAAGGAASGLERAALEDLERRALSKEEVDALGEMTGKDYLNAAVEGIKVGALFGAAPAAADVIRATSGVIRSLARGLTRTLVPPLSGATTRFTGITPTDVRKNMKLVDLLTDKDISGDLAKIRTAAQYQYDSLGTMLDTLEVQGPSPSSLMYGPYIEEVQGPSPLSPMYGETPAEWTSYIDRTRTQLRSALETAEKQLMTKEGDNFIFGKKLDDAIKGHVVDIVDGEFVYSFPKPFQDIQKIAKQIEEDFGLMEDVIAARPRLPGMSTPTTTNTPSGATSIFPSEPFVPTTGAVPDITSFPGLRGISISPAAGAAPMELATVASMVPKLETTMGDVTSQIGLPVLASWVKSLPSPTAVAVGQQLYNATFNQKQLVDNYRNIQKYWKLIDTELVGAAGSILGKPGAAQIGIRAYETRGKKRPELSLTFPEATKAFEKEREVLRNLTGSDVVERMEQVFGDDLDLNFLAAPAVGETVTKTVPVQVKFLKDKMDQIVPPNQKVPPTRQQLFSYGLYSKYVRNPETIYYDIAKKGFIPDQAIEVLTAVYPATFKVLKSKLVDEMIKMMEAGEKVDPKHQAQIDKIMGRPINGFTLDQIRALQTSMNAEPPAPQGGRGSDRIIRLEREGTTRE